MRVRLLFWSMRHRRWRHLLNVLTMAITVAVVMLFVSVMVELVAFTRTSAGRDLSRILVWPKILQAGATGLPASLTTTFRQIDGVKVVQCHTAISARHESGATYIVDGEEESGVELNTDFFPVERDVFEAWKKDRLAAIVSEATAAELDLKVGQLAEIPTPQGPMQIKVVGLSHGALIAHRIVVHLAYMHEHTKKPGVCAYRVFSASKDFERVAREIMERTKNTATPAQAFSDSQFTASWVRRVGIVPALLGFLGVFLVLTTALTLANYSAISIRERRIEIATLRVIGYRRGTIALLLLAEAALVGLVGGLLAIGVCQLVLGSGVQLTPGTARLLQEVTISPLAMVCGLAIAVLVPLAGALPAAISSLRLPLVEALRDAA